MGIWITALLLILCIVNTAIAPGLLGVGALQGDSRKAHREERGSRKEGARGDTRKEPRRKHRERTSEKPRVPKEDLEFPIVLYKTDTHGKYQPHRMKILGDISWESKIQLLRETLVDSEKILDSDFLVAFIKHENGTPGYTEYGSRQRLENIPFYYKDHPGFFVNYTVTDRRTRKEKCYLCDDGVCYIDNGKGPILSKLDEVFVFSLKPKRLIYGDLSEIKDTHSKCRRQCEDKGIDKRFRVHRQGTTIKAFDCYGKDLTEYERSHRKSRKRHSGRGDTGSYKEQTPSTSRDKVRQATPSGSERASRRDSYRPKEQPLRESAKLDPEVPNRKQDSQQRQGPPSRKASSTTKPAQPKTAVKPPPPIKEEPEPAPKKEDRPMKMWGDSSSSSSEASSDSKINVEGQYVSRPSKKKTKRSSSSSGDDYPRGGGGGGGLRGAILSAFTGTSEVGKSTHRDRNRDREHTKSRGKHRKAEREAVAEAGGPQRQAGRTREQQQHA